MLSFPKKTINSLYILLFLVYLIGLFIPVMENDSAQHAVMAMRMYLEESFLEIYRGSEPYLDKPHLHFWLAALSYKVFGISEWAYRLPSFLFTILGAISCFYIAKKFYTNAIGHLASLIFLSSQAIILANHDVRTDAVLTGATIFSIWQLLFYIDSKKTTHIILGALGMGLSFSTKGWYGVGVIGLSLLPHLIYTKQLKIIFNYKTLIGLFVLLLTILPVLYAYYNQFGREGVEFILWNQNVNRITSSTFTQSSPDYTFFFHTLLWVFLPWSLIMYTGLIVRIKQLFNKSTTEILSFVGVLIVLILISFSKFKLPHYLNPLIALLSIFTAGYLYYLHTHKKEKTIKVFLGIFYFLASLLFIVLILILFFTFDFPSIWIIIGFTSIIVLSIKLFIHQKNAFYKLITGSVLMMACINFVLNSYFYPMLLNYQGGTNMTEYINDKKLDKNDIYIYECRYGWSLDFYTQRNTPELTLETLKTIDKEVIIYSDRKETIKDLEKNSLQFKILNQGPYFRVSKLNLKFLNKRTRASKLGNSYLIKIFPNKH